MAADVRFFTTSGGARIAYATNGAGPPLIYIPPLTSHIAILWEEPSFRALYEALGEHFTLIRYDRYGCGLSARDRTDFRWEVDVQVLGELIEHLGLRQVALFGQSAGAQIALRYALAAPGRIAQLLLSGITCDEGPNLVQHLVNQLIRADWRLGANSMSDLLLPTAPPEARGAFARVLREAATAEMMAGLRESGASRGLAALLPMVRVPTLFLARRDDQVAPLASVCDVAARIPGAKLAVLDGDCYIAEFGDVAAVVRAIGEFTGVLSPQAGGDLPTPSRSVTPSEAIGLSQREREVLRLAATGLPNATIAARLSISPRTVGTHLTSIYSKLGVSSRAAATRYAVEHRLA